MAKKFFIKTLGCRVNKAESEKIGDGLIKKGWEKGRPPDLVILNTCCVTNKAEKETRQAARALRRKYADSFLVVAGCSVDYWQTRGVKKRMRKVLGADLLIENKKKREILNLPEVSTYVHPGGVCIAVLPGNLLAGA